MKILGILISKFQSSGFIFFFLGNESSTRNLQLSIVYPFQYYFSYMTLEDYHKISHDVAHYSVLFQKYQQGIKGRIAFLV